MEIEYSWDELMPTEQKDRTLECWYCDAKVRYEDALVMMETFSDGKKNVYACPACYDAELDARAKELEECECVFSGDMADASECELHGEAA